MTDSTRESGRTLDSSLASGIAWTAALRWAAQLISWAATFWAARLLIPRDYGLVSMAGLGIGLVRLAENFGLDAVLVQDRSLGSEAEARLAGFVVAAAAGLVAVFGVGAPLVAQFFKEPELASIVRVLSVLLLFDAIQVVPRAHLQRSLAFQRLAIVAFVRSIVAAGTLLLCAYAGLGYWSLVVNGFAGAIVATGLLVVWSPFPIAWPRHAASLSRPLLQGWRVLASRIAWYGYSNADQTIVGRTFGSASLGAYSFATTFSTIAQEEIGSIVSQVVPGIFSRVQDQMDALRRYFLVLTEFVTVIAFPISFGMLLVADLAIPLALGDKWVQAIAPLRLLCLYSAFLSSQLLVSHLLLWTGQFRVQMWCSILALVGMPSSFLIAVKFGPSGIAMAWALVFPVLNVPSMIFAFRTIRISAREWLESLRPALVASALMATSVVGVRTLLPDATPLFLRTTAAVAAGAVVYPAVLWFVFNQRMRALIVLGSAVRRGTPEQAVPSSESRPTDG